MTLRRKLTWACLLVPLLSCTAELDGSQSNGGPTGGPNDGTSDPQDGADPTVCIPGVPQTSQIPRLTRVQYDNTIRDLFGLESQPSSMLAPDTTGSVDNRAWDGYQRAAESIAAEVMADAGARARVITCEPTGEGTECAQQIVEDLGSRVFRRPLTEDEKARFLSLYTRRAELTPSGTFEEAVELLVQGFLVSPSFLMIGEITEQAEEDRYVLSPFEVASRLSYMLWSSMPDEELFAAATAGELSTSEQILTQARRMMTDPKARAMVAAFHASYLHMGPYTRWTEISRDPERFPAFSEALIPLLSAETERFVDYIVFEQGGTFQDLVTSPVGFVNADLAPLYGLDPAEYAGSDLVRADLDPATRSGVFTRLGFLASHSLYDRTSPILRGAFLQKDVLCAPIGTPPPNAEGTPLPTEGLTTNRERVDAQTAAPACAGCHHTHINPTGFALEAYDAIGALQDMDNGVPIDSSASVVIGGTTVDVSGPVDLFDVIANAPEAHTCYARSWVQFAYNRELTNEDSCTVDDLASRLAEGGYTVLDLVADLTQSEYFRYRAVSTEVAQ